MFTDYGCVHGFFWIMAGLPHWCASILWPSLILCLDVAIFQAPSLFILLSKLICSREASSRQHHTALEVCMVQCKINLKELVVSWVCQLLVYIHICIYVVDTHNAMKVITPVFFVVGIPNIVYISSCHELLPVISKMCAPFLGISSKVYFCVGTKSK